MAGLNDGISGGGGGSAVTSLTTSGNVTLGDASSDNITFNGQIASNVLIESTYKLYFRDTGLYLQSAADGKLTISADGTGADDLTLNCTTTASDNITISTDKKLYFRDTGLYINSGADGKLTISADGTGADDLTLGCTVTISDSVTMADAKDIKLGTTGKVQFRDTALYISSKDDGHLDLDADTSIDLNATTGVTGDFSYSGHKDGQILLINGNSGFDDATDGTELWYNTADGLHLPASQTAQVAYFPIPALKVGDEIVGFRIFGKVTSGGNAVTVDAKLTKVNKDGTNTDVTNATITQVSKTTNYTMDEEDLGTMSAETVAADYAYHLIVTGTTGAACTIDVTGIEIDINRK